MSRKSIQQPPAGGLAAHLKRFAGLRLLVVGDSMLDHFLWGRADRISPEAPVPVVRVERESLRLGGAANVAANLRSLGAAVRLISPVGADAPAAAFKRLLRSTGIAPGDLVAVKGRPTTQKTRVIAHHQQVVRFDHEDTGPLPAGAAAGLRQAVGRALDWAQAVIVSDYDKGVVHGELMDTLARETRKRGLFLAVDPRPRNFALYKGADIVTPNLKEASEALGAPIKGDAAVESAARQLIKRHKLGAILITRGEEGMSLVDRGRVTHIPTMAREVYDVTGAGDTVIAALGLAVAAGAPLPEAALIANLAAGVVVGEVGTVAVRADQLAEAVRRAEMPNQGSR